MRFLLDTNVLIALAQRARSAPANFSAIFDPSNMSFVSAASLWEIAIKVRLRKLDAGHALEDLAGYFDAIGLVHLPIDHRHVIAMPDPVPATRDPFDRLLLAQCAVEGLRLVTTDRALAGHPLSWQGS